MSRWTKFVDTMNRHALEQQERKSREHELKARETFRDTTKQLREAESARKRADRPSQ